MIIAKRLLFVVLALTPCLSVKANDKELLPGYYVVVGAYAPSRENVAQNYAEVLNRKGLHAAYGFNSSRNYYFVYLSHHSNLPESLKEMYRVRQQGQFTDAWVRVVPGDVAVVKTEQQARPDKQTEPVNETVKKTEVVETPAPVVVNSPVVAAETKPAEDYSTVTENPPIEQFKQMTLGNTQVFLSLYNATNDRIIDGNVKVISAEKNKQIVELKGNDYLNLPDPKTQSGRLLLIAEVFGYRKVQQEINYPMPLADTVKEGIDLLGTTIVVNFDMVRYRPGDIATLYNVYFFNDAAVMLPESKYELTSLLQMMQENPEYRIRLHGHTNGNYHGKVVKMGNNKSYFSLEGSAASLGSAKDLSYARADVIRQYLIDNNINADRIEVKAWGGKKPIYDKHGPNAKRNVRVEVEILK